MNVIYRVHGAGGFYMETQSQDQAFRTARQEAAPGVEKLKKSQSSATYAIVISSATLNK